MGAERSEERNRRYNTRSPSGWKEFVFPLQRHWIDYEEQTSSSRNVTAVPSGRKKRTQDGKFDVHKGIKSTKNSKHVSEFKRLFSF